MLLTTAQTIAERTLKELQPYCFRAEIAGSVRRMKPEVKDIEIVCIPKPYATGLFQDGIASIVNQWQKVKGELEYGKCKYTQRILPEGIKLDLFFAVPENWGLIFLIRTGSKDFNLMMLERLRQRSYRVIDGILRYGTHVYDIREEQELFERAGMQFVPPEKRSI